jgi:hypothetical protein
MGDEASLYSGRRRSTSTSQARRCGALLGSHGRCSLQGRPPNDEDATDDDRRITGRETRRISSTKQRCNNAGMISGAKLDGLATRNTAGSTSNFYLRWQACSSDKPHQRLLQPTVTPENRNQHPLSYRKQLVRASGRFRLAIGGGNGV